MRQHVGHERGRDERGSSTAQFVLTALPLIFGVFMIIQSALYFHARNVSEQAAQEGAAAARAYDGSEPAAHQRTIEYLDQLDGKTLQGRSVRVSRGQETARVTVSGTVMGLLPGLTFRVEVSAAGPVERYVPPREAP